jgi:beta-lactamase class A
MRALRILALLSITAVVVLAAGPRAGCDSADLALAPPLPLARTPEPTPLRGAWDADLQRRLDARVRADDTWRRLVDKARMSVGLVDLRDPGAPRYAALNGDTMMYAASLPKIAILLAAFQGFENHTFRSSPEVVQDLTVMIRRSDNKAATRMVDRLGLETIARTLTAPAVRLYDVATGGGLWVGRAYAQDHPIIADPLKGLLHAATAYQVCRFYYLLANGQLVSPERSAQMLALLANTAMGHKFAYHLKETASLDHVFRKSGTWKDWHSDSALVWQSDGRRYILAALVDDARGEQILRDLLPAAEEVLAAGSRLSSMADQR